MNIPKIVAILNVTPDSFSDGDRFYEYEQAVAIAQDMIDVGVDIIDIGAESTRPGAIPVSINEEIRRLSKIIPRLHSLISGTNIELSLDSRNYEALKFFIDYIDIINDVTGLEDERVQELAAVHDKKAVFMHSLSVPVKKSETVSKDVDIVQHLQKWFNAKIQKLEQKSLKREQLIFDPGIGFGLDEEQSINIIKGIKDFDLGAVKIMIGHSRKSFLAKFGEANPQKRDPETHATTLYLAGQKVDYVRVHDFEAAKRVIKLAQTLYA
jgi:dihydropteroate synthase